MSRKIYIEDVSQSLPVTLVQTLVPEEMWNRKVFPGKNPVLEWEMWQELRLAMRAIKDSTDEVSPKIILIPELSVPESRIYDLKKIAQVLKSVIICGVDYKRNYFTKPRQVENRACVIVPFDWPLCSSPRSPREIYISKCFPSLGEKALIEDVKWEFKNGSTVYVFESKLYGRIGVCICYDFLDVERHLMYRGQIQHLFVVSYNRDFESFYHNAEALSRTLYCNVVVCNTGTYGGSLVVSPYYKPYERTVYRHQGGQLSCVQNVKLPVRDLIRAQSGAFLEKRKANTILRSKRQVVIEKPQWKSLPPGYPKVEYLEGSGEQMELDLAD